VNDVLAALAEPNRRRLLELLRGGEMTVTELASHFEVTRPAISQHLGVLAEAGLVDVRQNGRFRHYRLNPAGMSTLRSALDAFWTSELEQLAQPFKKGNTDDD
jgi:DNA-binding transcriptional ArsR family regulator